MAKQLSYFAAGRATIIRTAENPIRETFGYEPVPYSKILD